MKQLLWCVVVIGGLGCESPNPQRADGAIDRGASDLGPGDGGARDGGRLDQGRPDQGRPDQGRPDLGLPDGGADARPTDGGLDGAPPDLGPPVPPPLRPGRLQWTGGAAGRGVMTLEYQAPGVRLRGRLTP